MSIPTFFREENKALNKQNIIFTKWSFRGEILLLKKLDSLSWSFNCLCSRLRSRGRPHELPQCPDQSICLYSPLCSSDLGEWGFPLQIFQVSFSPSSINFNSKSWFAWDSLLVVYLPCLFSILLCSRLLSMNHCLWPSKNTDNITFLF